MDPDTVRRSLSSGRMDPAHFRAALIRVPEAEREVWLDRVFGLGELPRDDPGLPPNCVPYLPCAVAILLRMIELADVRADDVFVDLGSGLGRAAALVHLATGAGAIGVEIQPSLVRGSRELAARLNAPRLAIIEGDAARLAGAVATGSVFFLYCPFSGERLERALDGIEWIARARMIRVCAVDLPLPPRPWLEPVAHAGALSVYRSAP